MSLSAQRILLASLTQALSTRLLREHVHQNRSNGNEHGDTMLIRISPKLLASIVDELSRNATQALMPLFEELAEAHALIAALSAQHDRKAFASAEDQALHRRVEKYLADRKTLDIEAA